LAGRIYYIPPAQTVVKIETPIRQWIVYKKNEMLIYNPDENKAFRIIFEYPVSLPFFQAFIGVLKEDFGLSELGYTLSKYERRDASLISIWVPPKQAAPWLGDVTLEYRDNKLICVEFKDSKGKMASKSVYAKHVAFNSTYFPMEISTVYDSSPTATSEFIQLKNSRFNAPLPQDVANFQIPPNVVPREIRW